MLRLRVLARQGQAERLQAVAAQAEQLQAVAGQLQVLRFQVPTGEAAVFQMAARPKRPR